MDKNTLRGSRDQAIKSVVDLLIAPETADKEAAALSSLLFLIVHCDPVDRLEIAETASRHAFTKTDEFYRYWKDFAGMIGDGIGQVLPFPEVRPIEDRCTIAS